MSEVLRREPPITHEESRAAAEQVFDHPGTDGVEVVIAASHAGLTRYALSEIIQNTVRREVRAYVRVVVGDRFATATTTQLDADHLRRAVEHAAEAARASRPDPDFPGLPDPSRVGRAGGLYRFDDRTAAASPAERAEAVRRIIKATGAGDAAGIFETGAHSWSVHSSAGIDCHDAYTRCVTSCLAELDGATGWGDASSHALEDVDVESVARRALAKARAGRGATDAEPGAYEVVLEPSAVAEMLDYLSYSGFGAKQVLEGDSFLASRTGDKVAADAVTIADDVTHPGSVGIGFDFEGVPKRRVAVIDSGVASGPVSDLRTARKLGVEPTGHFSGSGEFGPYASNVVMEAGEATSEDLIAGVDEGLLVTRFHYVNVLDRPKTLLTGMTRDGTFRIRSGEIAEPVHNLRFTQSVLEALASGLAVGRELDSFAPDFSSFGSTVAPGVRLGEFHFTSRTSH